MLRNTRVSARWASFEQARSAWGLDANFEMKSMFPLLHSGHLLPKALRSYRDYQGRKEFDEDHPLPVMPSKSNVFSDHHDWTVWDRYLNPQLISDFYDLPPTPEYVGPTTGRLIAQVGWRPVGGSHRYSASNTHRKYKPGEWAERHMTPKWAIVPRIAAIHPDSRWQGKLQFVDLSLSKIIWAMDTQRLNRNEVITLNILVRAEVIPESDVVWPGINLVYDLKKPLKYPIHLELQNADPEAINAIETAGGTFTGTYMSIDGIYQEMKPEEFPAFQEQNMPDRPGFHSLASNPRVRGFLSQWYEDEGKYAHPDSGRRLAHYVKPPTDRDFPATYDEYERARHQQKWHLGQGGSATILPFVERRAIEDLRPPAQQLGNPSSLLSSAGSSSR